MKPKDSMVVPKKLVGAWRRVGLVIDGTRRVDYCDVLWLQSDQWFADIRLRLSPQGPDPSDNVAVAFATEGSFAGVASWSDPTMTWEHILDIRENPPIDISPVQWQNGGIIEGGTMMSRNGKEVPWAEEWIRLTDDSTKPEVTANANYVRIAIGDHAIEVQDKRPKGHFVATRYHLTDNKWVKIGSVQS